MPSLPAAVGDKAAGPAEDLAWKEMLGILDHELSQLSDRYHAPLVLCYLAERTQDEAAWQLGWSLNTLRRRLAHGRRLLEARLRGRGVSLPAALAGLLAAGAVAVPAHLRAATLAAAGARAALGLTASDSVLSSARKKITLLLTGPSKNIAALVALAVLGAAVCLAYSWNSHADQAQAANDVPPQVAAQTVDVVQDDRNADRLPTQGTVRLGTARYRHGTRIENLAVSADGNLAVTASGNSPYNSALAGRFSPARVFDLTDGRCLYSLPNERGTYAEYPQAVSLSPDGKTLAIRDERFLYFRDAATGKQFRKVKYPPGREFSHPEWLTFTPDGKQVAVTMTGTAVLLIEVETGEIRRTFDIPAAARACVFSPDGKLMATGGYEQEHGVYYARLWEVVTGKELRRFAVGHQRNQPIEALAFSHDGTKLAGGSGGDGRLRLFEVATGKELHVFPKIGEEILAIAFAPDGKTVAAAGDRIHLYDPVTATERLRIDRKARALVFSRDGSVLIGAVSGAIYRWDAASGRQLTPAPGQDSAVEQIFVSADGRSLFTTDQDGDLCIWDTAGDRSPRRIAEGIDRGVVASSDRRFLAWAVMDVHGNSRIRLYDVAAERVIDPDVHSSEGFSVIGGAATVVAFLPDGKSLLTLQAGQSRRGQPAAELPATFRLWDVESGKEQRSFLGFGPKPFCTTRRAALSSDGKTVAIGRDWAATFGNRRMKPMDGRAFSPDGRFLVDWAENPLGPSRMDHVYIFCNACLDFADDGRKRWDRKPESGITGHRMKTMPVIGLLRAACARRPPRASVGPPRRLSPVRAAGCEPPSSRSTPEPLLLAGREAWPA